MASPQQLRVLVIEDDITQTEVWNHIFYAVNPNAKITWAKTAEAAQALIYKKIEAGEHYHVIISDYLLAGEMNGIDLWRKFYSLPQIYILNSVLPTPKLAYKIEPYPNKPVLIQKPIDIDEVISILKSGLKIDTFVKRDHPNS